MNPTTSDVLAPREVIAVLGEVIPGMLCLSTADGRPTYQNPAWLDYTGVSSDELSAGGWDALLHPDDRARFQTTWADASDNARAFECEYRGRRRDGAYRWFLHRGTPILDRDGRITHWVSTLTDVHALKVAEAELELSVRRRDEFLATLAHELRNPLQAIRQAMYVLQLPDVKQEASGQMHDVIERQLNLLTRFTDQFLDFNKVRWNAMTLRVRETTLQSVVDAAVLTARPTMATRGQQLDVYVADPDCNMLVDHALASQALANLLSNASEYSDHGGRVSLRAHCQDGRAEFTVDDNGIGIDASMLTEIFKPFVRTDETLHSSRKGPGIGLALVRHIATLHGGSVVAESNGSGTGSRFTLRVPLVTPPRVA